MDGHVLPGLKPKASPGARVVESGPAAWRLEIPAGPAGRYRLAQLDDYDATPRRRFPWTPPGRLSLRARASASEIPGTWGFGWWNDPFGMAILSGAEVLRLPALPNAAWFFFASHENYLSLRNDLPATGRLAASFAAPRWPAWLLALGAPALPLFFWPAGLRLLRRLAAGLVRQSAVNVDLNPTAWHSYDLEWQENSVAAWVDGAPVLRTSVAPRGPLGLVLWVDNQFMALPPSGKAAFGTLENPEPAWIELELLEFACGKSRE